MKGEIVKAGSNLLASASKNAPKLLTWANAMGVVLTAVTAVNAYKKSEDLIEDLEMEDEAMIEKIKQVWPYWIVPTVTGAVTIFCGFKAENIQDKRYFKAIAATELLKTEAMVFREKAIEEIGKKKVQRIEHDIHADELKKIAPPDEEAQASCDVETGGILLFDRYSGQYIKTTYERVYRAAEHVNAELRPYGKGGRDWYSHADFIVDCGGEYAEKMEDWGYAAKPFNDVFDVDDICDVHIQEYKDHRCTIVWLNVLPESKSFL